MNNISKYISFLELTKLISLGGNFKRSITAIAGPPGSGKSTLSARIVKFLNKKKPNTAAVFSIDGYHFDNLILNERGMIQHKGAPNTFDVGGIEIMLNRLLSNEEKDIAIPIFDRNIDISRNSAFIISQSIKHIIFEGNYLLLNEEPWKGLSRYIDRSVFLETSSKTLKKRLKKRWDFMSPDNRKIKLEKNDYPNINIVLKKSAKADYYYLSED